MKKGFAVSLPILVLALAILACSVSVNTDNATRTPEPVNTRTPETPIVEITSTSAPSETPTLTLTVTPSPTSTLTVTPSSTATLTSTATNTPIPCNRAEYVDDVNYPDGTDVFVNANFTKTWRLRNTGSCSWTSGYRVVFISGDKMGAANTTKFTNGSIDPGETVDISVNLTAPSSIGDYRGYFKLRDSDGALFGYGPSGDEAFWVEIETKKIKFIITPFLMITLVL
jgi:hypothetical protein